MLEREYLKASTASVLAKPNGAQNKAQRLQIEAGIEESKIPLNAIGGMLPLPPGLIQDELGEEQILAAGGENEEDIDESAYRKLMMQAGYPGGQSTGTEPKTWI